MANDDSQHPDSALRSVPSTTAIQDWFVEQLASALRISPDRIKVDEPILSYGVDSMQVVTLIAKLEDWLGFRFSNNPLEDHPTIESLAQFVADRNDPPQSTEE